MKSILFDETIPHSLKPALPGFEVTSVQEEGWGGIKNGDLLLLMEDRFDLFITADKNLRYQQNISTRKITIIELPFNSRRLVMPIAPLILDAINRSQPYSYIQIEA